MTRGEEVLAVAYREIGYCEGANKRNKYGAYYRCDGYAWCMFFVQWCYERAGMKLPKFTGSCGELLRWYRANRPERVTDDPVPGCVVIFDFPGGAATDHTGLFVRKAGGTITTIDGNTSGVSQSNGGWVQQKTRQLSYARPVYIVPEELTEAPASRTEPAQALKFEKTPETEAAAVEERYHTLEDVLARAKWAYPTIRKLTESRALGGTGGGLDLSTDMLRVLVINDRMGLYEKPSA